MTNKHLNDKPFSKSTLAKLRIFEDYTGEWIPTMVMGGFSRLCIFDFFAGSGTDVNGVPGSSIRILQKLNDQLQNIIKKGAKIILHLNELDLSRYKKLQTVCHEYLDAHPDLRKVVELHVHNEDFGRLFPQVEQTIEKCPSLVFLDQNGIKFLSPEYLLKLEKMRQTDFLFFVASSFFRRFGDRPEFRKHIELDMSEIKAQKYKFVHQNLIDQLRRKLPIGSKLKLYPFSLKKGSNIYGVIFGATHPLAFEKFIGVVWRIDEKSGASDFDIDDHESKRQRSLFEPNYTKKEVFQDMLRNRVLNGTIANNIDAFDFCLEQTHPGNHAREILLRMKKDGDITFEGKSPLVTYDQIYNNDRLVQFINLRK